MSVTALPLEYRSACQSLEALYAVHQGDVLVRFNRAGIRMIHEVRETELANRMEKLMESQGWYPLISLFVAEAQKLSAHYRDLESVDTELAGDALSGALSGPNGIEPVDLCIREAVFDERGPGTPLSNTRDLLIAYQKAREPTGPEKRDIVEAKKGEVVRLLGAAGDSHLTFGAIRESLEADTLSAGELGAIVLLAMAEEGYEPDCGRWERSMYEALTEHDDGPVGVVIMDRLANRAVREAIAPDLYIWEGTIIQRTLDGASYLSRDKWVVVAQSGRYEYSKHPTAKPKGPGVKMSWQAEPEVESLGHTEIEYLGKLLLQKTDHLVAALKERMDECARVCAPPEGECSARALYDYTDSVGKYNADVKALLESTVSLRSVSALHAVTTKQHDFAQGLAERVLSAGLRGGMKLRHGPTRVWVSHERGDAISVVVERENDDEDISEEMRAVVNRLLKIIKIRDQLHVRSGWSPNSVASVKLAPEFVPDPSGGSVSHAAWARRCEDIFDRGSIGTSRGVG